MARIGIKAADPSSAGMLAEGERMMVARLTGAMPAVLEKIVDKLFEFSEQALDAGRRGSLLLLHGEMRQRGEAIAAALRQALAAEFDKAVAPNQPVAEHAKQFFDPAVLRLVDFDAMEESIAVTHLASGLRNGCSGELRKLNSRTARLLGARDFDEKDNPFGPEVVANAFKAVFSSIEEVNSRVTLLQLVEQFFPEPLAAFYTELDGYFASRGVVAETKYSVKKARSQLGVDPVRSANPIVPAPPAGDGNWPQAGADGVDGGDLFGSLQQLIMMGMNRGGVPGAPTLRGAGGGGGAQPMPLGAASVGGGSQLMPPMARGELLQVLTHLQRGDIASLSIAPDRLPENIDLQQLVAGAGNVLRNMREAGLYNASTQVDAITIDVVAMLFDYVFDDKDIPAAVRVLIGRLQIPVLKAAMLDKKFFSKKDNPARKMLDRLAQVAVAWSGDVGEDDPLYRRIAAVVHDVIDNFEEDVSVFDRAVEQLDQYIAQEQTQAEEHSKSTAEALYQREIAEFAQIVAREEVIRRAGGVPPEIQQFLLKYWLDVLAKIYEQEGETSEAWNDGLSLVDDLAWSIEPKAHQEDRLRLVRTLPQLLKRLEAAMRDKSAGDEEIKAFSAKLVELHIAALKGQATQEQAAETDVFDGMSMPAEVLPASEVLASQEQDLAPAEPSAEAIVPAAPAPADDVVIETLKWTLPTKDLTAEDEFDQVAKRMKKGCWVEFGLDDGTSFRSKLTWISPMKGVMLFADRDGSNAVKISPKSLAKRFRNGTAAVLGDASLVERAVTNVMGQLMKNAGPGAMPQNA